MVDGVEAWSPYGAECVIITKYAPFTELLKCGIAGEPTLLTYTESIYTAASFPGVTYHFRLQRFEAPLYDEEIVRSVNWFNLNMLVVPVTAGLEYSVTVTVTDAYGSGEGKSCTLMPALGRAIATGKVPFGAAAYPNPFANNFMIDVTTRSEAVVHLKVYDMIGRLIDQRDVQVSNLETSPIGDNYPSGVYNVVVTQGDEVKTVRVVKR